MTHSETESRLSKCQRTQRRTFEQQIEIYFSSTYDHWISILDIFTSIQLYGTWLTDYIFILQIALSFSLLFPSTSGKPPLWFSLVRRVSARIGGFLFSPSLDNVSRSASIRPTPSLSLIQVKVPGSHRIHTFMKLLTN